MKLALALFTLVPLTAAASPARDQSVTSEPIHDGLYLQFTPGIGVAATSAKLDDGSTVSLYGPGGSFGIAIGAALAEHWIIAVDLSGTSVFGPTFKKGDMEVKTDQDVKWNTAYVGAMAAYYVMPINLRINAGLGAFRMALDVPNMDLTRSNVGVADVAAHRQGVVGRQPLGARRDRRGGRRRRARRCPRGQRLGVLQHRSRRLGDL